MGNFEKLSVLVIVVIIVMILVVAIYTWTDNPDQSATTGGSSGTNVAVKEGGTFSDPAPANPSKWEEIFKESTPAQGGGGLSPIGNLPGGNGPGGTLGGGGVQDPEPGPIVEPPVKPEPVKKDPEPVSSEPWMYTVKSGDTLSEIAMRELGSIRFQSKILALNPGLDPNSLRVGQQIKMPAKTMQAGGAKGEVSENPPKVAADGPSGGSAKPTPGEHYVTRSGDTLERISKRAYGTIEYWGEIWASNLKTLETPSDIRAGMKLFIPAITRYGQPK